MFSHFRGEELENPRGNFDLFRSSAKVATEPCCPAIDRRVTQKPNSNLTRLTDALVFGPWPVVSGKSDLHRAEIQKGVVRPKPHEQAPHLAKEVCTSSTSWLVSHYHSPMLCGSHLTVLDLPPSPSKRVPHHSLSWCHLATRPGVEFGGNLPKLLRHPEPMAC